MNKEDFIKLINLLVDKKVNSILKKKLPQLVQSEIDKQFRSGIEPDDDVRGKEKDDLLLYSDDDYINRLLRDDIPQNNRKKFHENKQPVQENIEQKKFSKDPMINQIMQQTATEIQGSNNEGMNQQYDIENSYRQILEQEYSNNEGENYPSMNFGTGNMGTIKTPPIQKKNNLNSLQNQVTQTAVGSGGDVNVAKNIIKDYSGYMKKLDKAAKSVRNKL